MKKTSNPSALRTQTYCKEALMRLYTGKNYDELSIKIICAEANVTRQAFYKNFKDKKDLVYAILDDEMEAFIRLTGLEPAEDLEALCSMLFQYWSRDTKLISLCLDPIFSNHVLENFSDFFLSVLSDLPDTMLHSSDTEYRLFKCRLLVTALGESMRIWQTEEYRHLSAEEVAHITASILNGKSPITINPSRLRPDFLADEEEFYDLESAYDYEF